MKCTYDDSNLQRLLESLTPDARQKAIKGALRRQARRTKEAAVSSLRATGINNADALSKGIRAKIFKRAIGFRVTAGSGKGAQGMHTNRKGKMKPILRWAEDGTGSRSYRKRRFLVFGKRHNTGAMPRLGFMAKTKVLVRGSVTDELRKEIINSVKRTAKRYGCK
ncbi:MAG: hypothetical protein Q4F07_06770 [Bacteroidales bacterium]|nr:hypothetical protein [Bacteroidales bacterium]